MTDDPLDRFVQAQFHVYDAALAELQAGAKRGHWMWFIFPQIAGLGRSPTAQFYAIANAEEAKTYLAHPLLGRRLDASTKAMIDWRGRRSAAMILGDIDALKLRSSMTLFEAVGGEAQFGACLDAFYDGDRDSATLRILEGL